MGYVSGHASLDLKTGQVIGGSIEEETGVTLSSIGKVLKEAGCTFEDVVNAPTPVNSASTDEGSRKEEPETGVLEIRMSRGSVASRAAPRPV